MLVTDLFPLGLVACAMAGAGASVIDGRWRAGLQIVAFGALLIAAGALLASARSGVPEGFRGVLTLYGTPNPSLLPPGTYWHHPHARVSTISRGAKEMRFEREEAFVVRGRRIEASFAWDVSELGAPYLVTLLGDEATFTSQLRETVRGAMGTVLAGVDDDAVLGGIEADMGLAIERDVAAALQRIGFSERQAGSLFVIGPAQIVSMCAMPCLDAPRDLAGAGEQQ